MKIEDMLMKALTSYDNNRERSQQEQIGVSQLGGCRKQVWLQLNKAEKTNQNTLRLPALMGTAIHKMIEEALVKESWGEYWLEEELEYDGIKGHVDLYIPEIGAVVDWKTTKLKNLDYFPSKQQRWQVHVYAWLIQKAGNATPKTVTLVAIPRDGDERQIKIHTEEYNEQIALEAIAWLRDVQARDTAPEPERYAAQFCQHYCPYFGDKCGGKGKEFTGEIIEDTTIISAVKRYLDLDSQIKELTAQKDGVKATLENVSGVTPDGVKVSWSQINGRTSIDEQEVKKLLGFVPTKQGDPSMRLTVK
jgi:PD-(D/E)XK nuclease superfamily